VPAGAPIPPAFELALRVDGLGFKVRFAATPGVRRYVVPLDRLWFWSPVPESASRRVLTGSQAGVDVAVVGRAEDPGRLY